MIGLPTFVAGVAALVQPPGTAQPSAAPPAPQAPPCSTAEYRQLDFWVGEWRGEWTRPDGTTGTARNVITRDEYGSCVITERFTMDDGSMKGMSISTYFRPAREWRQTWMDSQGSYFDLFGGPSAEGNRRFLLETYRRQPQAPFLRMSFEDVTANSFTWRWQSKASAEAEWADRWVIRYTRSGAAN